jgi:hypothetical protein
MNVIFLELIYSLPLLRTDRITFVAFTVLEVIILSSFAIFQLVKLTQVIFNFI